MIKRFRAAEPILPPLVESGPFLAHFEKPYSASLKPSLSVIHDLEKSVRGQVPTASNLADLANSQMTLISAIRKRAAAQGSDSFLLDMVDSLALSVNCSFELAVRQYGAANRCLRRVACDKSNLSDSRLKDKGINQPLDPGFLFNRDFEKHLRSLAESLDDRKKLASAFGPLTPFSGQSSRPVRGNSPSRNYSDGRSRSFSRGIKHNRKFSGHPRSQQKCTSSASNRGPGPPEKK